MKKTLTPEQLESRKKTNKKVLTFGCLPIVLVFLIFWLVPSNSPPPKTVTQVWKEKAERFETNIKEAKNIDFVNANFDSLQGLMEEYTPEMEKDSSLVKTHSHFVEFLENKPDYLNQKKKDAAYASLFNPWNGSNLSLVKTVKNSMNDPDSFEHVETLVWPGPNENSFIVKMKFRGNNAFGAKIINTVRAVVNYNGSLSDVEMQ